MMSDIIIVYEDDSVVVIYKPAGLIVHPVRLDWQARQDGKSNEPGVTDWVKEKYPEVDDVGEPLTLTDGTIIKRPGIVHRLDRETSGVLVIAKTQEAFRHLKKQFKNRTIEKVYSLFTYGVPKKETDTIDRAIGRSAKDFRLRSAQRGARGTLREAQTEYRVLEKNDEYAYIEARPRTGRTHQLRAHFKAIGHPIVCDRMYAPKKPCALGFDRLALHSRSITFKSPEGETITAEAVLPNDFKKALEEFKS